MATIQEALHELGIKEWAIFGEPTNEAEFKSMFKKSLGEDENGRAILSSKESDFGVTWKQIQDKKAELEKAETTKIEKKKSAKLKLKDLGLDDEEINALIGQ